MIRYFKFLKIDIMGKLLKKVKRKFQNLILFKRKILNQKSVNFEDRGYLENHEYDLYNLLDNIKTSEGNLDELNLLVSRKIRKMLDKNLITMDDISLLISGKLIYNKTGLTPDNVQQLMVDGYCKSNGLFQEVFYDFMFKDFNKKSHVDIIKSDMFGDFNLEQIEELATVIEENGYVVLPKVVKREYVDSLKEWSYSLKYRTIGNEEKTSYVDNVNFSNPDCVTANAIEADLLQNKEVMSLINDPVLLAIISRYLGVKPVLIHLCMWWSFMNQKQEASSEAAQLYHYDLDHMKWLKVFFYLSDVTTEQGPHTYIPVSHKIGRKNYKILQRGYARVTDAEMKDMQSEEPCSLLGEAGTVIIGDTKCFHKGTPVVAGSRLVLQPTFGPSEFLKKLVK